MVPEKSKKYTSYKFAQLLQTTYQQINACMQKMALEVLFRIQILLTANELFM